MPPEQLLRILTSLLAAPAVASAEAAVPLLECLARLVRLGPPQSRGAAQVVSKLIGCCNSEGWTEALFPAALEAFAACAASALDDVSGEGALSLERLHMLANASQIAYRLSTFRRVPERSSGADDDDDESSDNLEHVLGEQAVLAVRVSLEALKVLSDSREGVSVGTRLNLLRNAAATLRMLQSVWRAPEPPLEGLYPALLKASTACRLLAAQGSLSAEDGEWAVDMARNSLNILLEVMVHDGMVVADELQRQVRTRALPAAALR
jgi:hypothetical protein